MSKHLTRGLLALCLLLSACGPKDIGHSQDEEEPIRTSALRLSRCAIRSTAQIATKKCSI